MKMEKLDIFAKEFPDDLRVYLISVRTVRPVYDVHVFLRNEMFLASDRKEAILFGEKIFLEELYNSFVNGNAECVALYGGFTTFDESNLSQYSIEDFKVIWENGGECDCRTSYTSPCGPITLEVFELQMQGTAAEYDAHWTEAEGIEKLEKLLIHTLPKMDWGGMSVVFRNKGWIMPPVHASIADTYYPYPLDPEVEKEVGFLSLKRLKSTGMRLFLVVTRIVRPIYDVYITLVCQPILAPSQQSAIKFAESSLFQYVKGCWVQDLIPSEPTIDNICELWDENGDDSLAGWTRPLGPVICKVWEIPCVKNYRVGDMHLDDVDVGMSSEGLIMTINRVRLDRELVFQYPEASGDDSEYEDEVVDEVD
ncbi:hypothetical protein HK098_002588 [Nowakowskiella sp. JEL0407]|nr:hypothetical protein HK098_002588 [Nowakowskiella sp. JEL0407]